MNKWTVTLHPKIVKKSKELPEKVRFKLATLANDLQQSGYIQPSWPNFGVLNKTTMAYHCHLKKGHPTYVACWQVTNKEKKIIEVYYVGTHENAPY